MYKLKLIKPKHDGTRIKIPPLSLLTLATLTPGDKFDIEIIDGSVEKVRIKKADIVGITVSSVDAKEAYKIADQYRKKGAKVILGGIHVSFHPEEAIKHADTVVKGEAENIWDSVLADFSKGRLKKFYHAHKFPDLSKPSILDYTLLKNNKYLFSAIQTTRGCPYNCEFCSVIRYNGRKQRHKKIEDVIEQIKHIKKVRKKKKETFFIVDDNLTVDKTHAKKLFLALIPLNIRWFAQLPVNFADDDGFLDLAYKSGLRVAVLGFESINQKSLDSAGKINSVSRYSTLIKKLDNYGILIWGLFVIGLDGDTRSSFKHTFEFCQTHKILFAFFHVMTPFYGTPLHKRLEKEDRLIDSCGEKKVCFIPRNMSTKDLSEGIFNLHYRFYSLKNMFKNYLYLLRKNYSFLSCLVAAMIYASEYARWKHNRLLKIIGREASYT